MHSVRWSSVGWLLLGCGATTRPPAGRAPAVEVAQLTIEQRFVTQSPMVLRLSAARDSVTADARVRLLRHRSAPATHAVRLRVPRVCGAFDGAFEQLRVDGAAGGGPIRAEVRDGALLLQPLADGVVTIEVQGEYVHGAAGCADGLGAGARVPVRARVRVEASQEAGRASLGGPGRCGVAGGPFSGARSPVSLEPVWLDASGEPVSFANVSSLAPFEVHVESQLAMRVAGDGRLALPERSGTVRLTVPGQRGSWLWRWRVAPAEVTDATVRFFVGGSAGSATDVVDGARITGSHRKVGAVFVQIPRAVVGDEPLCDAPDPRWFELHSDTPDVCVIRAIDAQSCDECSAPTVARQAAWLLRDGVCAVRLEGAAMNHGRGVRRRVSASFESVSQFANVAPGLPGTGERDE
jgi:hypothetical protein